LFDTCSAVDVESRPTANASVALVEPARFDPERGVKTAVRRSTEVAAANEVWHVRIAPCVDTGSAAHPLIGVPPFSNLTDPEGGVLLTLDVTVAINVTCWFVTGAPGTDDSVVAVEVNGGGGGGGGGGGLFLVGVRVRVAVPTTWGLGELSVAVIVTAWAVLELVMVAV
jgi:hypothetical protein